MAKTLTEAIKNNPLQTITVGIAVAGVVVSILNFYLLSNISPIERRVAALEETQAENLPLINDYLLTKQQVEFVKGSIGRIELDIRDIKNYLNVNVK